MDLTEKICFYWAKYAFLEGMGANNFSRMLLHFALPVYTLNVSKLEKDDKPSQAEQRSWQFLATDAKGIAVAGEVPLEPDSHDGYTTSLARGTAINDTLTAYRRVREHPGLLKNNFELRRLRISSLQIDTFWLKALPADGPPADKMLTGTDLVYSFTAFPDELKLKMLPAPEFLTNVRKFASDRHPGKVGYLGRQNYQTYQNTR